jgi:hypothetical protein
MLQSLIPLRSQINNRWIAISIFLGHSWFMTGRDENEEALRNVEKATDSEPVKGENLVESEELKRKFREAKERLREPIGE